MYDADYVSNITMDNVAGVLYSAEKYDLVSLKMYCDEFLSRGCESSYINALHAL